MVIEELELAIAFNGYDDTTTYYHKPSKSLVTLPDVRPNAYESDLVPIPSAQKGLLTRFEAYEAANPCPGRTKTRQWSINRKDPTGVDKQLQYCEEHTKGYREAFLAAERERIKSVAITFAETHKIKLA